MSKPRLFTFCLAFIVIVSGISLGLAQKEIPALIKKVKPAVVVIYIYNSNDKLFAQGSGFFINAKGEVITNIHVLQGAYRGEVKTSQGTTYFIKGVIGGDIEGDLIKVVLDTTDETFPYLQVSTSMPDEGEKVVVIRNPLLLDQTVSDGVVSAVRDSPPFGTIIQITAPISPGSSGSPVVNMNGEVIGVVALKLREDQRLNYAIPAERIINLKPMEMQSLQEWTTGTGDEWLESAQGLFFSGLTLFWEEDYAGAIPYFEEAVKKEPDFAEAHINLGALYGKLGRYKEAIEALKQAIRLQPDSTEAHCYLGLAYCMFGYYKEAIEILNLAVLFQPNYARAHFILGLNYIFLGDKASALDEYKILKTLDPALANKLFNLIYK